MLVATKTVNYVAIKVLLAVIRIHPAARTANLCQAALNVVNRFTRPVNVRRVALELTPSVPSHRPWKMEQSVRNEGNVVTENAVC